MDQPKFLSSEQVAEIVGPIDDLKLAEIIASGATLAQITTAKLMLADGESIAMIVGHADEPPVTRVYEILKSEELEPDEP
jgi:hypothetical protein